MRNHFDENKQGMAVTALCEGLRNRDAARHLAVHGRGKVNHALRIASAFTAYDKFGSASKPSKFKAKKNLYLITTHNEEEQVETSAEPSLYVNQEQRFETEVKATECAEVADAAHPSGNLRGRSRSCGIGVRGLGYTPRAQHPEKALPTGPLCYNCQEPGHLAESFHNRNDSA